MSFVDDLRKLKSEHNNSEWVESRTSQCLHAIEDGCKREHLKGHRKLSGELYCDDSDYGTYTISPKGTYFRIQSLTLDDLKQLRFNVEQALSRYGFISYRVELRKRDELKLDHISTFGKRVMRKTGLIEVALYIEATW